jgi:hypothetical protein
VDNPTEDLVWQLRAACKLCNNGIRTCYIVQYGRRQTFKQGLQYVCHLKFIHTIHMFKPSNYYGAVESQESR